MNWELEEKKYTYSIHCSVSRNMCHLPVNGMSKISSRVILHTDSTALRKFANELLLVTFNSLVKIVKLENAYRINSCLKIPRM